jgi:hypothetical protein
LILSDPGPLLDPLGADLAGRLWLVLRVASGDEPRAAIQLAALGLSLAVAWRRRDMRISRHVRDPIMRAQWHNAAPGYGFAGLASVEQIGAALRVDAVRGVLMVDGRPCQVAAREVADFVGSAKKQSPPPCSGAALDPADFLGRAVAVRSGPFKGLVSNVSKVRNGAATVQAEVFGSLRPLLISLDRLEIIRQG